MTHSLRVRSKLLVAVAVAGGSAPFVVNGQTNGMWIPTSTAGIDWNTPSRWIGAVPDGGGVATFNENDPAFPSTGPVLSTNIALSQIQFNSAIPYEISGSGSIVLPGGGGMINVLRSQTNEPITAPNASFAQYNFAQGSIISAPLTGGPLAVGGSGAVGLASAGNSYAGGTTISGATLSVTNDSQLGNAAGSVTLTSGGTLAIPAAGFASNRSVIVSGSGRLQPASAATFNGVVSGSGTLTQSSYSTAGLTFTAANTFAGTLQQFAPTAGVSTNGITLSGNGSFANLTNLNIGGFLRLDNTATVNLNDRIGDTAAVAFAGGSLRFANALSNGNISTSTQEVVGTISTTAGYSILSLVNVAAAGGNPGTQITLKATNVTRSNGALMLVRGGLLSDVLATTGSGLTNFISVNAPAGLAGGSGAAGSADLKIVPWMVGGTASNSGTSAVSFMTWNASNGALRPLAASEYASSFGVATNNVQFAASASPVTVPGGGATVNSLTLNGAITIDGASPISVTSGGVQIRTASGSVINAPIAFPAGVEGIFVAPSGFTTTNVISGNSGVTKGFSGEWVISGNGLNSTYSGPTMIVSGIVSVAGDLPLSTNSALGNTSAPIILAPGEQSGSALNFTTASTIDRPITAAGDDPVIYAAQLRNGAGQTLTFNGGITLNRPLAIVFGDPGFSAGSPTAKGTINGVINGTGSLVTGFAPFVAINSVVLNGANTFSGGVIETYGQVYVGSNSALGTGAYNTTVRSGPLDLNSYPTLGATAGFAGTDTLRTLNNTLVVNGNGLRLNNAIPLKLAGTIDLNGKDTTLVAYGAPTEISGSIQTGSLTIVGGSTVTLSGTNTFRGGRTASDSTFAPTAAYGLTIGGSTVLPDGSTAAAGKVVFASPDALPGFIPLTLGSGALATAASHGAGPKNSLFTSGLTLAGGTDAWDSLVDLRDNDMVIRGGDVATVLNQIKQAAAGNWSGTGGITSSTAATATPKTALGYELNNDGSGAVLLATFDGRAVGLTDVLIKYTFAGDANLDGSVNFADLVALAQNYNMTGTVWNRGDFTYDGLTAFADLVILAQNYNVGPLDVASNFSSDFAGDWALAQSLVPEPGLLGIFALTSIHLARRAPRKV